MSQQQITALLSSLGINMNWRVLQAFIENLKAGQSRYFSRDGVDVVISYTAYGTYLVEVA